MRRHSIIIFLASFVFFINYNTFATNYSSYCNLYQTSSSSGYEEVDNYVYYNQLMTLSNVKVGFTQDDSNYFFKITADATLNSGSGIGQGHSNSVDNMQPMLYKTANFGSGLEITEQTKLPYADFNNGDLYTIASLNINGVNIGNRRYKYHQSSSTTTTSENVDTNNGDKYFIPNAARSSILRTSSYRYASSFPIALQNNGIGVNLIKNSSSTSISTYMFDGLTYVGDITASIDIELEIEKTYIDDYRYLCFGLNMPVTTSPDFMNNYWKKRTGISVCTDTIDVKSYANCEHSWTVISSDNTKHKIKCSICEWEKEEEHDFKYEYDGIKNDLCECGFKKQIKIYSNFNSSSVTDTTQTIKINATYTYNNSPTKTGYIFKKFKKYINDIKPPYSETKTTLIKTYISDVTTMDTNAGDLSIIYDAQYEPIKYNVKLDSTNNKSVPITITTTNYNNREYDTEYTLPTLTYAGYKFLGWTKTKNSEKVDFAVGTKYKNLTTSNGATITLYPVFAENHYTLKFSKINNLNLSITTDIKDLVCGYGTKYNLPDNIDFVGYNFLGWSLTKGSTTVNFVKNAEIYNFTTIADKEYTLYPVYEAKKYAFKFSKENNLGISIDTNIADLVCDYGSTYSLPDNIEVAGYKFLGWTFTKGSSLMNFGENAMIQNYTDIDNKEYILYPVYDYRVYTIKCDYEEEGAKKSILLGNVVVEKKRELPKMKVLPITAKGYGWFYNDKSIESSLDLDKYITKDDEIITIEYKLDKGASAYADDIKEFTYTINCKYWQETETKSITLEKVVIGVKRELPKMKVLPITANNYGWFYNGIKVNDTNDIDPYVIKNNDIITIEYKLDKGSSAYADDVKEFTYTIDCRYWNETATKSIVIKDVKIGHLSELPKIKVLPITAKGYGWFYKENKVASSFDIDQYITKNNETITLEYKLDKGASAYTDDIKEFLYTIDCKYWNETATKSIIIKDVKIGSISELPKIKVLPITAKGYGWFYKENEVVNSLDVDQYVTRNNETITLEYKLDVGASAYTDDVLKFRIAYNADIVGYKKNENISTIEFGKKIELLKLEDVPDNISIYGWYYNDKKNIIYNSEELEQYITKNNQLITLNLNYAIQNMTSISHNSGKGDGGSDSGPGSGSGGGSGNGGSGGSGSGGSGSGPGSSSGESSDEKTATHIMNDYKGEYGPGVENISVIGNANSILTDNSFNIISERDVSYGNNYVNRPFNNNKKEMNIDWSTFCGPRQLTEEDLYYNVRGVHGPWNFDEEYIKVLMEKKNLTYDIATISTIDNENEYSIIDDENEYNIIDDESDDSTFIDIIANKKSVILIIATILLLIAFIIYEIFTLKSILDKK